MSEARERATTAPTAVPTAMPTAMELVTVAVSWYQYEYWGTLAKVGVV